MWESIRGTENLAAVTAVVFPSVEGVELLVALEASGRAIVFNPLLLRTERRLYYLLHFLIHLNKTINLFMVICMHRHP